ncbi:MAG: hypothetical protein U9O50_06720 [Acidobacteriota bacterium]|nr:hypothetical protein [Acidobacteriota bacterium]
MSRAIKKYKIKNYGEYLYFEGFVDVSHFLEVAEVGRAHIFERVHGTINLLKFF